MPETTSNVIDLAAEQDPAGVRQARWRRNNPKPKKRKKPEAKPLLSAPAAAPETADPLPSVGADAQAKNDNVSKEVSNGRDEVATVVPESEAREVVTSEIRPVRRGGGGGNFRIGRPDFSTSHTSALDVLAILAAISLTGVAAWLSINGMVVLFPALPVVALWLGASIEGSKIVVAAWLGRHWNDASWLSRVVLIGFTMACASLNAASVYSQLVQGHVGPRGAAMAARDTSEADAAGRIEVAQGKVADLDRRLRQIDDAIDAASRRGRTREALNAINQQRQARAALASERDKAARELADLKTQRVSVGAQGRAVESETTPLRYLAELLGVNKGPEELIRFLIAAIVACGDPFAIVLAAVAGRRRWA